MIRVSTWSVAARQHLYRGQYLQRALRCRSMLPPVSRQHRPGWTVVIVNWNSESYLRVSVAAVRRFSPANTQVIVVDNNSHDGSRGWLAGQQDVRTIRLPRNIGHEVGLDIGFLSARTVFVMALDVDAFPISDQWIPETERALREGAEVAGAHLQGGFVHPCFLGMTRDRFVQMKHSFAARRGPAWAVDAEDREARGWDTGWSISLRENQRHLVERTALRGPGDIGSVFGGLVYHNFYSTRFHASANEKVSDPELAQGVSERAAAAAWAEAVSRFVE